jgi:hypothetical protein
LKVGGLGSGEGIVRLFKCDPSAASLYEKVMKSGC